MAIMHPDPDRKLRYFPTKSLLVTLVLYFCSRVLLCGIGIRFDVSGLEWYYQFIDPLLLKTRLLERLYYDPYQPPLFNLFLGVVLKLCCTRAAFVFQSVYLLMGYTLTISIFMLLYLLRI